MAMVKLYNLCLEQNLPEPQYETKSDKKYGVLSTCTILNYIGKGSFPFLHFLKLILQIFLFNFILSFQLCIFLTLKLTFKCMINLLYK